MNTKSWDEIVHDGRGGGEEGEAGQWIVGRGWHQEKWTQPPQPNVEGFRLHASLDAVSPNNPVVLTHASGHGVVRQREGDGAVGHHARRRRIPTAAKS